MCVCVCAVYGVCVCVCAVYGVCMCVWYMVCGVGVCFESWDRGVWVSSNEKADLI